MLVDAAADRCYDQAVAPRPPMSEEQLKAFLAKAKDDQSIQDKLKAAKTPENVVEIAKEHGYEFTADKITELSEEDLEGVAGGLFTGFPICITQSPYVKGVCI